MRKIDKIIIHCSATAEGRDVSVDDIDIWHRKRGYRGIGYHYVVYRDGSVHAGRPPEQVGAHCNGQNSRSIGICYIGGLSRDGTVARDTRNEAQRRSLIKLVKSLKEIFPGATVHGHNEFAHKACPSFNVRDDPDLGAL